MFFPGILVGLVLGVLLVVPLHLPFANWPKFVESTAIGFGIGAAFITLERVLNFGVKFLDKQSQKVKGAGKP